MISLHPHRHHSGPPQGPGRYSADGQQWFDEAGQRWLPVAEGQDTLCIALEDVHASSLRQAVAARLAHQAAPASRFVGHATSVDPRWPSYEIASAPFPRCRPLSETAEHREEWSAEMTEALSSSARSSRPPAGTARAAEGTPGPGATPGRGWARRPPPPRRRHPPSADRTLIRTDDGPGSATSEPGPFAVRAGRLRDHGPWPLSALPVPRHRWECW